MATSYFCKDCMSYLKAFVKDFFTSLAKTPIPRSEQALTGTVPCTLKCLDFDLWDYDRLCAALDDPNAESCIRRCSNIGDEQYPPHILIDLCQLYLSQDENELHPRDLITPPTDTPTGKGHTHTRAPPKITSNAPTHKTLTLTELTEPPSTRSTAPSQTTTDTSSLPTTFITSAASSFSSPSSTSTSTSPDPSPIPTATPPPESNSISLSPGAKAGIAIGTVLLCIVLWIALRCCFKHGGKLGHRRDAAKETWSPPASMIPEKHGSPVNEIDSRVTAHPPGPVHDSVFELGGEPVVASRSGGLDAPKFLVTGTEGNQNKGKAVVRAKEASGEDS